MAVVLIYKIRTFNKTVLLIFVAVFVVVVVVVVVLLLDLDFTSFQTNR